MRSLSQHETAHAPFTRRNASKYSNNQRTDVEYQLMRYAVEREMLWMYDRDMATMDT